jgi:hypothetical protein
VGREYLPCGLMAVLHILAEARAGATVGRLGSESRAAAYAQLEQLARQVL